MTLSSEILVKEKSEQGGGGLPVTVGLDQHPADKQASLLSLALLTLHVLLMYDRHSVPYHTRAYHPLVEQVGMSIKMMCNRDMEHRTIVPTNDCCHCLCLSDFLYCTSSPAVLSIPHNVSYDPYCLSFYLHVANTNCVIVEKFSE